MKKLLLPSALSLLALATSANANLQIDFGSYADSTAFGNEWSNNGGGASSPGFSWAGGAVGLETGTWGGGGFDTTMNYTGGTFDFAAATSVTVSTMFQFKQDTGTGFPAVAQVGLSAGSGERFRDDTGMSYVAARLTRNNTTSNFELAFQFKELSGSTQTLNAAAFPLANLNNNTYYLLEATITKVGGSSVDAVVRLINYGTAGTTAGSVIATSTTTSQNIGADFYNDAQTYLGLRSLVDNDHAVFTSIAVVPEPSTYALLLGALAVGFVALRRRRR